MSILFNTERTLDSTQEMLAADYVGAWVIRGAYKIRAFCIQKIFYMLDKHELYAVHVSIYYFRKNNDKTW
jgi:hypothetical protein